MMAPDDPERKLDAWLDEALAHYSASEPRPGLESRVLDRLTLEKRPQARRWWKTWAPALATAAAMIIVTLVVIRTRVDRSETLPAHAPAPTQTSSVDQEAKATAGSTHPPRAGKSSPNGLSGFAPKSKEPTNISPSAGVLPPTNKEQRIARTPKRAPAPSPHTGGVFPAPTPLSEQERLALAAIQKGLLTSPRPGIPPGDELLPQVAIQEIEIKPIEDIKLIGTEDL